MAFYEGFMVVLLPSGRLLEAFGRIVVMSKTGVGDVSTRTTPGVALRGEKPSRKYFSSLYLTTWPDNAEPKTSFILALYRIIPSSAELLKSQRLWRHFWRDFLLFSDCFEVCSRVNNLRHRHISKTHRVSCVCPGAANVQGVCYWMPLASYTIGHPKNRAGKWEKVTSAECRRMLTRGPATTRIGFRASEGQPKVRGLIASALFESCLNYIVESCILRPWRYNFERGMLWYFLQLWPNRLLLVHSVDLRGCCSCPM